MNMVWSSVVSGVNFFSNVCSMYVCMIQGLPLQHRLAWDWNSLCSLKLASN